MITIQKFQTNNHLAVIFPLVVASAVVNCETSAPLSSQAWQKITDPPLLRHRECNAAIHNSDFMDYPSRAWTATSAWSLLTVTENKRLVSSVAQRGDPFTDPQLLRPRECSVAIQY